MADKPEEIATKFVSYPSPHLLCPVCSQLFRDPVINISCGHTFCRQCATKRLDANLSCPLDDSELSLSNLVVNRALLGHIDDLDIYCCHSLLWSSEKQEYDVDHQGCPKIIKHGNRQEHEDTCDFRTVVCPVGGEACGRIQHMHLLHHMETHPDQPPPSAELSTILLQNRHDDTSNLQNDINRLKNQMDAVVLENQTLVFQLKQSNMRIDDLSRKYKDLAEEVELLKNSKSQDATATHTSVVRRSSSAASGSRSTSLKRAPEVWKMPFQFKCIGTLRGHGASVTSLCFQGTLLVSASADCKIRYWNLHELSKGAKLTIKGHTKGVVAMAVGDNYLFSASHDNTLRAWSLEDGSEMFCVQSANTAKVTSLLCNETYVFTSAGMEIKVWDVISLKYIMSISSFKHPVTALAFNSLKDKLYSASHNTIETWHAQSSCAMLGKLDHQFGQVNSLAISRTYICAGTANREIQLFDVKTQKHAQCLSGHAKAVTSLLLSPCKKYLFSGSVDWTVKIWNLEEMLQIRVQMQHNAPVNCLSLQGELLLSGSEDSEIKVHMYTTVT